jgi:hypothetical protein
MKKMPILIKKYWILIFISLTACIYIASILIKTPNKEIKTTPNPSSKVAEYKNLIPGISNIKNVESSLGKPIETKVLKDNLTSSKYSSSSVNRFHQIVFADGKIQIIKEVITLNDNLTSEYITKDYGDAPYILYIKNSDNPFRLYVYPQNGISYLGHPDGTLLEIWYFQPTTIDAFIKNWGENYSKTPSVGNNYY